MRTLAFLSVSTMFAVGLACSSGDDSGKRDNDLSDDSSSRRRSRDENTTTPVPTSQPTPAPTYTAPPPRYDAGLPPTQTTYCRQLSSCCGTITSTLEKYSCMGVSLAGKETVCQIELVVCQSGGIIHNNDCADLNECCDQMYADNYPAEGAECRSYANQNNASTCQSKLDQYRQLNWCF
jgi:hypothetical protein